MNNNQPTHVIRCGNVKATCWINGSQIGYFYNTTITTSYRDKTTEEWNDSSSFADRDLLAVAHAAEEMYRWIRERKAAAREPAREES